MADLAIVETIVGHRYVWTGKQNLGQRQGDTMLRLVNRILGRIEDESHFDLHTLLTYFYQTFRFSGGYLHNRSLVMRAPSASAASFAQAIDGTTMFCCAAKVAKPQSVPATTRSRPTRRA